MAAVHCSAGIYSRLQLRNISISLHVKKKGVKYPHQATRLMDISGLWSLTVKQGNTKGAFFSWKCSQMIQNYHKSRAASACAGADL